MSLEKLERLRERVAGSGAGAKADGAFATYLDKVSHSATQITDEEVAALLAAGRSEDEIFEATAVRALDAAIDGYRAGLAALKAAK